jgi:hypothetical protein
VNRILRAIFTRDVALHVPLGAAIAGLAWLALQIPSPWWAPVVAAGGLYLREVTQLQARLHGGDFRTGWGLDLERHMEWAAPAVAIAILCGIWELLG